VHPEKKHMNGERKNVSNQQKIIETDYSEYLEIALGNGWSYNC